MKEIIECGCGRIRGIPENGITKFLGIPYAKPPIGGRRFTRPEKAEPFPDVFTADRFRGTAMQPRNHSLEFETDYSLSPACSEDCLYLNLWVPDHEEGVKLPVAFWIHGGGFFDGSGGEKCFDGMALAARGVILVTINYRLNVFGFLAHPYLSQEDPLGISGNYGLYDQEMALRWVRENIASFGGDPENITIFGQSAGSMSVQSLISTDRNRNAVAKAIMESGFSYHSAFPGLRTLDDAYQTGEQLLAFLKIRPEQLREIPADELLQGFLEFRKMNMNAGLRLPFSPIIDGVILKEAPDAAIDQGHILDIPYMVGCTEGDMGSFKEDGTLLPLFERRLPSSMAAFAGRLRELGRTAPYLYNFSHHLPGEDDPGAPHSAELWYVFGTLKRSWRPMTEEDEALSRQIITFWTNFMKYGNPNGESGDEWKPSGETCEIKEIC